LNEKTGSCEKTLEEILELLRRPAPASPKPVARTTLMHTFDSPPSKSETDFIKQWYENLMTKPRSPLKHDMASSPMPQPSAAKPSQDKLDVARKFHLRDKTSDPNLQAATSTTGPASPIVQQNVGQTATATAPNKGAAAAAAGNLSFLAPSVSPRLGMAQSGTHAATAYGRSTMVQPAGLSQPQPFRPAAVGGGGGGGAPLYSGMTVSAQGTHGYPPSHQGQPIYGSTGGGGGGLPPHYHSNYY